ncbi:MAG: hypothetical protein AB8B96_10435 [Lysobacterales bacterium]
MAKKLSTKKRNPVARNPLLSKGGAHKPAAKSVRPGAKALRDEALDQWDEDTEDGTIEQDG